MLVIIKISLHCIVKYIIMFEFIIKLQKQIFFQFFGHKIYLHVEVLCVFITSLCRITDFEVIFKMAEININMFSFQNRRCMIMTLYACTYMNIYWYCFCGPYLVVLKNSLEGYLSVSVKLHIWHLFIIINLIQAKIIFINFNVICK